MWSQIIDFILIWENIWMESKPDFVIGRSKKILKLNKTINKILYAAPAYNDTYVVLGQ